MFVRISFLFLTCVVPTAGSAVMAVMGEQATPLVSRKIVGRPSTFWTRLWEVVFAKPTRRDPPNAIKPHGMGGGDRLSIAGISPKTISHIPQSEADLVIPWYSTSDGQIIVSRTGQVIARAEGGKGTNQLTISAGRSQLGKLDVEIYQKRSDGYSTPVHFFIKVVDPTTAPVLPAEAKRNDVSLRVLIATYWSVGYEFCFYNSQVPDCGRWRLAAYQDWLAIRNGGPDERSIADYFIAEIDAGV